MEGDEQVINATKKWITDVVAGCNFCPFAAKEIKKGTIHYQVSQATKFQAALTDLITECERLDSNAEIQTSLLIFPAGFSSFNLYLELVEYAEALMVKQDYEGIYQLASFHPQYIFHGSKEDDPANYTNRSIYPMLHLLREDSITEALKTFPNPEDIPERNIQYTKAKGLLYMQALREACKV